MFMSFHIIWFLWCWYLQSVVRWCLPSQGSWWWIQSQWLLFLRCQGWLWCLCSSSWPCNIHAGIIEGHKVSSAEIHQTLKCPSLQSQRDLIINACKFSNVSMTWLQPIYWTTSILLNNTTAIILETKTFSACLLLRLLLNLLLNPLIHF